MNKIPVWRTIASTYRFAFRDFGAVLGVVWLPLAVVGGAAYFLLRDIQWPALHNLDTQQLPLTFVGFWGSIYGPLQILNLVLWICITVIIVGLTRAALGLGRPYVFFTLGAQFWRMFGANLLFVGFSSWRSLSSFFPFWS